MKENFFRKILTWTDLSMSTHKSRVEVESAPLGQVRKILSKSKYMLQLGCNLLVEIWRETIATPKKTKLGFCQCIFEFAILDLLPYFENVF